MRVFPLVALSVLLAGCGSYEYRNNAAAVDANPMCAGQPSQPGEPVAQECEREASVRWSSERESAPIDFKPARDNP